MVGKGEGATREADAEGKPPVGPGIGSRPFERALIRLPLSIAAGILVACALISVTTLAPAAEAKFAPRASIAAGQAWSWGRDEGSSPRQVLADATAVQSANWGGLALSGGNVYEWTRKHESHVSEVSDVTDVVAIGESSAVVAGAAVTAAGALYMWGHNPGDQLCTTGTNTPTHEVESSGVQSVSGGRSHMVWLMSDGTVKACGDNKFGELGDGSTTDSSSPVTVTFPVETDVVAISSGNTFTLALDSKGDVWAWGQDNFGQLGNGKKEAHSDVPVEVHLPGPATQVYAGGSTNRNGQSLALLSNGQVWAWGNDSWGQLGNDTTEKAVPTPVQVSVLPTDTTWVQVATGGQDSFAIDSAGNLWAWGAPPESSSSYSLTPSIVQNGVEAVSATAGIVTTVTSS